ncbi:hypothetical protein INS49_002250 [Diaporthe citri]|uniref:uncharacterized protein n=1 Tax=Diaporthe citri TaxID=83186 RepID=UPI001C803DF4|nr:uncharacterized protein INS49_002250 [Diaporthe citri]KAG6368050.1 hypothetical protein INS49_002250 [Diaporthe citri]
MAYTSVPSDNPPDYIQSAREHGLRLRQSAPVKKGPLPFELPIISHLKGKRVILASASPRRKALLAQVGLKDLEILPSTKPEDLSKKEYTPHEYVSATARQKCLDVYESAVRTQAELAESKAETPADPELVIAADTVIVTKDGRILEKPRSEADHVRMLRHLRDTRMHRVLTAVIAAHTEETRVFFASENDGLPDDVIDSYVRTREGADKAGGYAVQGIGGLVLIEKLEGSVDNVVGLPVRKTLALMEKAIFQQGEEEVQWSDEEEERGE